MSETYLLSLPAAGVEKVLVGTVRDLTFYEGDPFTGRVPYDAMVWFKLEKVEAGR